MLCKWLGIVIYIEFGFVSISSASTFAYQLQFLTKAVNDKLIS